MKNLRAVVILAALAAACAGESPTTTQPDEAGETNQESATQEKGENEMPMTLTSTAFKNGQPIPKKYTGDGPDVSPPLQWTDPPEGAKSFALICDDPDAPMGTWAHWIVWNIPATARELPEGVVKKETLLDGTKQGLTDFRSVGYGGPAPPPGKPHRYFFKLYALDTAISLDAKAKKKDLVKAMQGHILAEAQLMGTYQR